MTFLKFDDSRVDKSDDGIIKINFYKDNKALSAQEGFALWGMTLLKSGSMRFRWNESNPNRDRVLKSICKKNIPVAVEQNHTKIVYEINNIEESCCLVGDGILTKNKNLVPVITVADCMPICLYDVKNGLFGAVHSGWKGTGIAENWIRMAHQNYGSLPENICVAIGAHIHDCCYVVNQERAEYFRNNFSADCVKEIEDGEPLCKGSDFVWENGEGPLYRLSLQKANLALLLKCGIKSENIVILDECTCCNKNFGSNRRQTSEVMALNCEKEKLSHNEELQPQKKSSEPCFTVQGAFCGYL